MASPSAQPAHPKPRGATPADGPRAAPVLRTTRYDVVSSFLIALVLGLMLLVTVLVILWSTTWTRRTEEAVPVELLDVTGGFEDGAIDETLLLDTPEDPSTDPSLAEIQDEEIQVEETIENVMEISDAAARQITEQLRADAVHTGPTGSAAGDGRRPLGLGGGEGGVPRANRWFIAFADDTLSTYAAQLQFFGIRLGVRLGARIVFLTNVTEETPGSEVVTKGDANWLFFTWRGGGRRSADLLLFQRAGVDVAVGEIVHVYSARAEQEMARVELEAADGRDVQEIRRTYFTVRGSEQEGFHFVVTRQAFFN
jgi:hypothetical protein